jgi:asparagine synthase (glutamine-hydrolysing)
MLLHEHHRDIEGMSRLRYGLETRDPYCDRRFAEFTLGIPTDQFSRDGETRWLARRVLADRLPQELLSQTRRGRQCPEWHYLASRRVDQLREAFERIARSPLASRVLDVKRMKALLDTWPPHAEAAVGKEHLYQNALQRGIIVGSFLRWFEGGNA